MEGEARGRPLRPPPRPQPASRDSSPRRAGCPLGELGQAPSVPHPTCAKQPAGWGRLPLRLGGCVWVNEGTGDRCVCRSTSVHLLLEVLPQSALFRNGKHLFSLGSHLSPLVFVYFRVRAETKANVTSRRGWVDGAFTSLLRWSSILESKDGAEHQPPATGLSGFLGVSRDLSGFLGVSQAFSGFLPKPRSQRGHPLLQMLRALLYPHNVDKSHSQGSPA